MQTAIIYHNCANDKCGAELPDHVIIRQITAKTKKYLARFCRKCRKGKHYNLRVSCIVCGGVLTDESKCMHKECRTKWIGFRVKVRKTENCTICDKPLIKRQSKYCCKEHYEIGRKEVDSRRYLLRSNKLERLLSLPHQLLALPTPSHKPHKGFHGRWDG